MIPAHNGERYLAESIQSVLYQEYKNYELWVIDNCSTDRTAEIAQSFPEVHYRYLDEANVALARNLGVSLSSGEYIAFLDQDDIWVPQKLKWQLEMLKMEPHLAGVIGLQRIYLQPGCSKPHWLKQEFLEKPQIAYLPSALMVRRVSFVQYFDPSRPFTSDVDWFFKASEKGLGIGRIEEVVVHRRIHAENHSNHCSSLHKELLSVIKSSLVRKRHEQNN